MSQPCEATRSGCDKPADELIVNVNNLSQYKFLCPEHRNEQLQRPGWYRASEDVKQVVLMNRAKG